MISRGCFIFTYTSNIKKEVRFTFLNKFKFNSKQNNSCTSVNKINLNVILIHEKKKKNVWLNRQTESRMYGIKNKNNNKIIKKKMMFMNR